jgi:predicted protein tyrosine phosphatase
MYTPQENAEFFDTIITLAPKEYSSTTEAYLLTDGEHSYSTFKNAVQAVIDAFTNREKTLVHCQAGQSRSVAVAAAAISVIESIPLSKSLYECEAQGVRPHPKLIESARKSVTDLAEKY